MEDDVALQSDDFIVYGTAVDQLADDETASSKPVPIQEQIATDEKGRRRFHGAFTGGFSAGYFNTVGSIEGWTPRTFQSSRQKKGEAAPQRPEDYMDTDDFAAHGIAPKKITTTDSFSSRSSATGSRQYGVPTAESSLTELLAPPKESFGVLLLKKLGWKLGQGIGPRVTKREKYRRLLKEGKIAPLSDAALQAEEALSVGKLFAPDDTLRMQFDPKTNYHGIGYKGLDISSGLLKASTQRFSLFDVSDVSTSLVAVPTASAKRAKVKGMTGQAFGVGAFENDDEDIYTMDDMSRYDRVLGDGEKNRPGKEAIKSIEAPGVKIVEGFQRGTAPLHEAKIFPAPVIPRGFTGQHGVLIQPALDGALKRPEPPSASVPPPDRHHHPQHDAKSRSAALSDQPAALAPSPVVKSVFDLIPSAQKSRIPTFQKAGLLNEPPTPDAEALAVRRADVAVKNVVPSPGAVAPVASVEEMRKNNLELFAGAGSMTAASKITFQPFAKDPAKQQRYDLFLQRRHIKGTARIIELFLVALNEIWMDVGASMTEWEREREKAEFFRAAALYRPMSGLMAARFTRETDATEPSSSSTVEVSVDSGDIDKEKKAAAQKKMYGKLTRDVFEWHPDRLICKRFNVPNPYPTSTLVGVLKVKRDKFSMFNFLNIPEGVTEESVEKKEPDTVPSAAAPPTSKTAPNLSTASPAAPSEVKKLSVPEEKPTKAAPAVEIPKERPPMDLFRAIFDTSDVEDAGENDEPEEPFSMFKPLTDLSSTSRTESDPFSDLLDVNKRARALEKKEFSTKADAPAPVVGPEKPSPAMLATYAALGASMRHQRSDEDSSGEDRHRKKRRKEKSRKSDKKHKKSKKHNKKEKERRHFDAESDDSEDVAMPGPPPPPSNSDTLAAKSKEISSHAPAVRVPATESSSPEVESDDLSRKLRQLLPGKRLTAADFM